MIYIPLQNKEGTIKRRIAQYEQTLGLLEKLQHNEGGLRIGDTDSSEKEKEIKVSCMHMYIMCFINEDVALRSNYPVDQQAD